MTPNEPESVTIDPFAPGPVSSSPGTTARAAFAAEN